MFSANYTIDLVFLVGPTQKILATVHVLACIDYKNTKRWMLYESHAFWTVQGHVREREANAPDRPGPGLVDTEALATS